MEQIGRDLSKLRTAARPVRLLSRCMLQLALTAGAFLLAGPSFSQALPLTDSIAERVAACAACHGAEGRSTREGFFPRIAGKPAAYLYNQMIHFREGRRQSPVMTHMVAHLSDEYIAEIAAYFAQQHPPYPPAQKSSASPSALEHGRALVVSGDVSRGIPACVACHGETLTGMLPAIPGLIGLPRDYLAAQFGAWKLGSRKAAAPDCMADISYKLTPEDIGAISDWLASQAMPGKIVPAPASTVKLPMSCGGITQ